MKYMWRVEVEPSIFRADETFILGYYRWRWSAWLDAWFYVFAHPHAEAMVQGPRQETS